MIHQGTDYFCRASFPPEFLRQLKYTSVQREHKNAITPEALMAAIPEAAVQPNTVIQPVADHPGTYFFDKVAFETIPCFEWVSWFSDDFLAASVKGEGSASTGCKVKIEASKMVVDVADL